MVRRMVGVSVFGDYSSGKMWAMLTDGLTTPVVVANGLRNISNFGVNSAGEVYVVRCGRPIIRLVGP
jgi:hypothetical protein